MLYYFFIFLLVCIALRAFYRIVNTNFTTTEAVYTFCAIWILGFILFVTTHNPPKELAGINILTYYIATYMSHTALQAEALMPYQIVIAICLGLAGATVLYFRDVIKKLNI